MRKARRLSWRTLSAVALSAGLFVCASARAYDVNEALYGVNCGIGLTDFRVRIRPAYDGADAASVRAFQAEAAVQVMQWMAVLTPDRGPFRVAGYGSLGTNTFAVNILVGGPDQFIATCVLSLQEAAQAVDLGTVVGAVHGATSELQAGNAWLSQVRSDTQTTASRLATIGADVATLKGTPTPIAVDFTRVGKYWLVTFASVLGLYFTAFFSGQLASVISRGAR